MIRWRHRDAPPLPYGGFGSIFVEGRLSSDGAAFFADRILASAGRSSPEGFDSAMVRVLRASDRLPRPTAQTDGLDRSWPLPASWDLTWNDWRHWLRSRIESRQFRQQRQVPTAEQQEVQNWLVALPSRLALRRSTGWARYRRRAIHSLLGRNAWSWSEWFLVEKARRDIRESRPGSTS
jgi:hypothetical protein